MIMDVGIVVPARNEQDAIVGCLDAIDASRRLLVADRPRVRTRLVVVLDSCTDSTASLTRRAVVTRSSSARCWPRPVSSTNKPSSERPGRCPPDTLALRASPRETETVPGR